MTKQEKIPYILLLILALFVHLQGYFLDFFLDDTGLFGTISKNIVESNDYLNLTLFGKDWLDKPHLPFWCSALSMKAFGVNAFGYKLPAFVCLLLAAYYTFRLTKTKYDEKTAYIAVILLLSAQYTFMNATEGRVENFVMLAIIGSVFHIDRWLYAAKPLWSEHLFLSAFWAAFGMMSKGTYVLIFILLFIGIQLLIKRQFVLMLGLLFVLILTGIFIIPELYALYIQFDTHPEKEIMGRTGVSGIRWFLWDTQFGHFTNTFKHGSAHKGYFFFLHTLLWAFLPWAILFFVGTVASINKAIKKGLPEYYSLAGGLATLLVFSISKFQLPHYISILFPFFAIVVANFVLEITDKRMQRFYQWIQYFQAVVLAVALFAFQWILAPEQWWLTGILLLSGALFTGYILKHTGTLQVRPILVSALAIILVNAYLHLSFYPLLIRYRGEVQAAKYINAQQPNKSVTVLGPVSHRFEFYSDQHTRRISLEEFESYPASDSFVVLCTQEALLQEARQRNISFKILQTFDCYPNETLTFNFIHHQTRPQSFLTYYLLLR